MMYFVGGSFTGKPEDYEAFKATIKSLGAWSDRLPGTWLVQSTFSARRIRDLLKPTLQEKDRMFVGQMTKNWSATNMGEGFPDWIDRRDFEGPVPKKVL